MSGSRKGMKLAAIASVGLVATIAISYWRTTASRGQPSRETPHAQRAVVDPFARAEKVEVIREADPRGTLALSGLVVGPDSQPVAGAIVAINSQPRRVITADAHGSFEIAGLSPREYELTASNGDDVAGPVRVLLAATTEPLVIELRPGSILNVTVVAATNNRPVAGATVQLRGPAPRSATTDANGQTRLAALPLGEQRVVAWSDGFGRGEAPVFFGDDGRAAAIRIVLGEGATVSGVVVDPAGQPLAGARVSLESAAEPWWHATDAEDVVATDATGRFAFAAVAHGSYRVRAEHDDFASETSPLFTLRADRTDLAVQVKAGARVRGIVTDRATAPVAGARVRLSLSGAPGNAREAISDERGAFSFGGLAATRVELAASANEATSAIATIDLERGAADDVRLALTNTAEIAGIVVDDRGEPLDGIQVSGWQETGGGAWWGLIGMRRALTSSDGRFRLQGLVADATYAVSADRVDALARGLGLRAPQKQVKPGTQALRLVVAVPGRVEGTVAFDDGHHPAALTVRLTGSVRQTRPFIGTTGKFAIDNVPPGEYSLTVEGPEFEAFHYEGITVFAGSITDLRTVPARVGRRIEGRVVDAKGAPVAGARVRIGHVMIGTGLGDEDEGAFAGRGRTTETEADGTFALAGVGRGNVTIAASHPLAGRSLPTELAASVGPSQRVELVLLAQSAVGGTVTGAQQPIAGVMVTAQSTTAPTVVHMVRTGADGRFRFDKLAADRYAITVGLGAPMTGMKFIGRAVTVRAGEDQTVDLEPATGTAALTITATLPENDRSVVMAFTTRGDLAATNVSQVLRGVIGAPDILWSWNLGGSSLPISITGLPTGRYTTCIVPFPVKSGSLPDLASLMRETDLPATCRSADVGPAGASLSISIR